MVESCIGSKRILDSLAHVLRLQYSITDPKTGKRVFLCDIVARDRLITPSDSTIATDVEIYEAKINLFTVIGYVCLLVALVMPMALILVGKQIAAPFFTIGFAIIGGALVGRNSSMIYPGNLVTTIAQPHNHRERAGMRWPHRQSTHRCEVFYTNTPATLLTPVFSLAPVIASAAQ